MRTIKFRGYNAKNRKWLYGYYFVNRGKHFIVDNEEYYSEYRPTFEEFLVDPESVGQFTGLRDAYGKAIYEGDIVQEGDVEMVVAFSHGCFFANECLKCGVMINNLLNPIAERARAQVIGNIHENPELLKGGSK